MINNEPRKCPICGAEIPRNNGQFCSRCSRKYYIVKLKQMAVSYKGGKCERCGYDKNIGALDFHHLDPKQKEFEISKVRHKSIEDIKEELDKCILLCANCHREEHCSNYESIIDQYEKYKNKNKTEAPKTLKLKRKNISYEQRKDIIINSNIDFSKFGWSKKLEPILGIRSAPIVRWMKKNMPDFYNEYCYKEKQDVEIDQEAIIRQYQTGKDILTLSKEFEIGVDKVRSILRKHNVSTQNKARKKVYMIDKNTETCIMAFESIKNASIYCRNSIQHKTDRPSLEVINRRISECINGHRKTAYGFKWIAAE